MEVRIGDSFFLRSYGSLASVMLQCALTIEGISPITIEHLANSNRTKKETTKEIVHAGEISNLKVTIMTGTVLRGQCYVLAGIIKSGIYITLCTGYAHEARDVWWDQSGQINESPTSEDGVIRLITGTDPAANTEISEAVPTGARWKLIGLRVTLVTDANAANRTPTITLNDGAGTTFGRFAAASTQAASENITYNAAVLGYDHTTRASNQVPINIPIHMLRAGYLIRTATDTIQAGDNYGAPILVVEEWLEP